MKKLLNILCITLAVIFTLSLFSGCTPNNIAEPTPSPTEEASAPTATPKPSVPADKNNSIDISDFVLSENVTNEITKTVSKEQFNKAIECNYNGKKITVEPVFTGIPVSAVDTYKKNFLFVGGTVILNVSTQNGTVYFKVGKDGKISATDTDFQKINQGRDNSKYYPEQKDGLEGRVVGNDIMTIQEGEPGNYVQYLHTTKGERISKGYDSIGYFYNGLAIITQDKKVGLIDERGNEVLVPCIAYDTITYPPKTREFLPVFMTENAFILPIDGEIVVINIKDNKSTGVAFIGFYESYNQYLQEIKDSQYLTDYPALTEVSEKEFISVSNGTETFLIMPSELTASVQVYKLIRGYDKTLKEETLQSELLYEANNANPIVVKCNFSDVVSDVNIVITYKDGSTVEFSPACSGKGGELYIESKNKELIKDLTKW